MDIIDIKYLQYVFLLLKIQSNPLLVDESSWLKGAMRIQLISPKKQAIFMQGLHAFFKPNTLRP